MGVEAELRGLGLEERLKRRGVDERARTGVGEDERITRGADGHDGSAEEG